LTTGKVAQDVDYVLEAHEKRPDHMKLMGKITNTTESQWGCGHESEYVELSVCRSGEVGSAEMFLLPGRGLHASDYVVEAGWDEVVFPWYQVLEAGSPPD